MWVGGGGGGGGGVQGKRSREVVDESACLGRWLGVFEGRTVFAQFTFFFCCHVSLKSTICFSSHDSVWSSYPFASNCLNNT